MTATLDATTFQRVFDDLTSNIEKVIFGKTDVVRLSLVAFLAEGHLLLEDVPGVGKTMLAKALSATIGGSWRRIQFTPDLLPSDVTGVSIYNQKTMEFEFHRGPVFTNVVIADEINRASPKTQAAMLEVMEERQVTEDGQTYGVPRPFMVIATQNPIELEGTYRLPEAQLDRFMLRTSIGHPDIPAEVAILKAHAGGAEAAPSAAHLLDVASFQMMIDFAASIYASDAALGYIAAVSDATRRMPELRMGVSPRGSLGLLRSARVLAASQGRDFVTPDDIKFLASPVLAHRVLRTPEAELAGRQAEDLIEQAVASVPVPMARA